MSIQPKVIALGFFDGVHLGHGALLRRTVEEAKRRGVRSAVFTWAQPPKEVVTGVPVPLINSPEDRAWLAKSLYGIDDVIMVPFNKEMMTTSWKFSSSGITPSIWWPVMTTASATRTKALRSC